MFDALQSSGENLSSETNAIAFTSLLNAYAAQGDVGKALRVLAQMTDSGVQPNTVTYTSLVNAHVRAGDLPGAWKVVDRMRKHGAEPNAHTFTTLLSAHAKAGQVKEAWGVLDTMAEAGTKANVVTYNCLLQAHVRSGDVAGAARVLGKMEDAGISNDPVTFRNLISLCLKAGDIPGARAAIADMREMGFTPRLDMYNRILQYVVRKNRDVEEGERMLQEMREARYLTLDAVTYSIVIGGHVARGDKEAVVRLMNEMFDSEVSPDSMTWSIVEKAVGKEERERLQKVCSSKGIRWHPSRKQKQKQRAKAKARKFRN